MADIHAFDNAASIYSASRRSSSIRRLGATWAWAGQGHRSLHRNVGLQLTDCHIVCDAIDALLKVAMAHAAPPNARLVLRLLYKSSRDRLLSLLVGMALGRSSDWSCWTPLSVIGHLSLACNSTFSRYINQRMAAQAEASLENDTQAYLFNCSASSSSLSIADTRWVVWACFVYSRYGISALFAFIS